MGISSMDYTFTSHHSLWIEMIQFIGSLRLQSTYQKHTFKNF